MILVTNIEPGVYHTFSINKYTTVSKITINICAYRYAFNKATAIIFNNVPTIAFAGSLGDHVLLVFCPLATAAS